MSARRAQRLDASGNRLDIVHCAPRSKTRRPASFSDGAHAGATRIAAQGAATGQTYPRGRRVRPPARGNGGEVGRYRHPHRCQAFFESPNRWLWERERAPSPGRSTFSDGASPLKRGGVHVSIRRPRGGSQRADYPVFHTWPMAFRNRSRWAPNSPRKIWSGELVEHANVRECRFCRQSGRDIEARFFHR